MDNKKILKVGGLIATGLGFLATILGNFISEKTQSIEIQEAVDIAVKNKLEKK